MSEASYRTINSLLIEFARDRIKDWKSEVAYETAAARRRKRPQPEDEDVDEDAEPESSESQCQSETG